MSSTAPRARTIPRRQPLVGRQREQAALADALRPGVVVVTGPPGVGKSTLIDQVVADRADGLWVDLSGARSAADLWAALGRALGVGMMRHDDAAERVARLLQARGHHVVVLDPAELLAADAWPEVAALVAATPQVCWCIASVVTPPLDGTRTLGLAPLSEDDAVDLLLKLATAQALDDPPDPGDPTWRSLARRLDGLPLALELAATRLPLLPPAMLLARLDDAHTLSGGRHASAEGALRYAWALLSPEEQGDLAALSPMRGGFTLDAAEAVLGPGALERLDALRSRSALIVRKGRFQLLEGLRRIARQEGAPIAEAAARRLTGWWAARADTLRLQTRGPRGDEASRILALERHNLWAAWERAVQDEPRAAVSIGAALLASMHSAGPTWGLEGLQPLADLAQEVGGPLGVEALNRIAALDLLLFRTEEARPLLVRALALAEEARDAAGLSYTLANLGLAHLQRVELDAARASLARAAAVAPDDGMAALAFTRLGAVETRAGEAEAAAEALEEADRRLARGAFPRLAGTVHLNLGVARGDQGRLDEAEELLHRAIEETRVHDEGSHSFALLNAALVALARDDVDRAVTLAQQAVDTLDLLGSDVFRGYARLPLGLARWSAGDRAAARALLLEAARFCADHDPQTAALTRAWRAALDGAAGRPDGLEESLEAARGWSIDPDLLDALAALGSGGVPPAEPEHLKLYARIARRLARPTPPDLKVARDGRWFERVDQRADLSRRGALHRILAALVQARLERPGQGLSVDEVFEAGWPGEKALPDAAAGRVYTAVRELRGYGLGDLLQRHAEGYLLDAEARIAVEG